MLKTKNTYEASFYLMYGATLKGVKIRKVAENKIKKKGYQREWILELDNIPSWAKRAWEDGYIYGDLVLFSKTRDKLKKTIKYSLTNR